MKESSLQNVKYLQLFGIFIIYHSNTYVIYIYYLISVTINLNLPLN